MGRIGTPELLLLLGVLLVVFGPSKLPEIGRTIGSAIGGFKKEIKGDDAEVNESKGA
ncbi:MAG: twin-arginine translocase TatA/TatE family subunit [Limnochordia bacterium]|jgi:sec-independent protein translocase protein TatA|nr:twin-arginine translocase TatA/TatE family subunit [Limnochordia bacterium]